MKYLIVLIILMLFIYITVMFINNINNINNNRILSEQQIDTLYYKQLKKDTL